MQEELRALGVREGDVLMAHVSMRALAPVRAEALVVALDRAVGDTGTVMVTLGAPDDVPFDALTTPADPDVGVFAEVFRTTPGTRVSDHPDGRFGARGRLSGELTRDVPWHDYYGPGSPLDRFVAAGGRVLRLGADDDTTTLIHLAEQLAPLPDKRRVRRHPVVLGADGPVVRTVDTYDDSDGIADYPGVEGDEFAAILGDYVATGRASSGTVGRAAGQLIDGADLVAFAVDWIVTHARSSP